MRRYTLTDNLISALIGVVIAVPVCACAYHSWNTPKVDSRPVIVNEISLEYIDPVVCYEVEPMTEEDIAEEIYLGELELLALCVEAEAGNQGLEGKRLVVDVILNRVDSPDFPNTIEEVITQPYHFSSYWNGAMDRVDPTEETYEAVTMELETRSYPSLLYFTAGGYGKYGTPWKQIGDHYFCTK